MAPPAGFDTEQIRDKARKDLLYLLSVVSQGSCAKHSCGNARSEGPAPLTRRALCV